MRLRDKPIYLSSDVYRALWLLSKAEAGSTDERSWSENVITTPDEIADQMLRQAIREQHPQLQAHQQEIEKLEKNLIANLAKNGAKP